MTELARVVMYKNLSILAVILMLMLTIGYWFSTIILAFSETSHAYLSDDFLAKISSNYLKLLIRANGIDTLRAIDVRYRSFHCNIKVNVVISNLNNTSVITINSSGLSLSTINGFRYKYYRFNTTYFINCLRNLYSSYAKNIILGLKDLRIYSPLVTRNSSKLALHENFMHILKFLVRYPLYEFKDSVFFVWIRVDPYLGYISGNYNLNIRFYGDSIVSYKVNLQGLASDLPILWGPSFAWHKGIRYIEDLKISLERIDGTLNSTAMDIVLGFVEYKVPKIILEIEDEKGRILFIKPWVDIENLYDILAPLIVKLVKTYTSPLFAYFDSNRFYIDNTELLISNYTISPGMTLSFNARIQGRITGLYGFENSPYYSVFGSSSISINGESDTILRIERVSGSHIDVAFLLSMLRLNTVPEPRVDKTLCMDLIDSTCLYLSNVSKIISNMRRKIVIIHLERTSLLHSQLSTYTINYPGVLPYMAITIGYTPKNTFALYPVYPAIRIENISKIRVEELKGYPVRTTVNYTVRYPNNITSNIIIEPFFMIPLRLQIQTNNTILSGYLPPNKTYMYRIENYEYLLNLTSTSWYPYTYLSLVKVEFPERTDIDNALIIIACGNGACNVNVTNNTITITTPYKIRIMFFIKGERRAITKLLSKHVRVIDYYGIHRLDYPGIMSSYILPNNTSIVFGWTLLLPPRSNNVKIIFSSLSPMIKTNSIERFSKTITLSTDIEAEENNYFRALLALSVMIISVILYILLRSR